MRGTTQGGGSEEDPPAGGDPIGGGAGNSHRERMEFPFRVAQLAYDKALSPLLQHFAGEVKGYLPYFGFLKEGGTTYKVHLNVGEGVREVKTYMSEVVVLYGGANNGALDAEGEAQYEVIPAQAPERTHIFMAQSMDAELESTEMINDAEEVSLTENPVEEYVIHEIRPIYGLAQKNERHQRVAEPLQGEAVEDRIGKGTDYYLVVARPESRQLKPRGNRYAVGVVNASKNNGNNSVPQVYDRVQVQFYGDDEEARGLVAVFDGATPKDWVPGEGSEPLATFEVAPVMGLR